jgi:hypothetical protein
MSYFEDLSVYSYMTSGVSPNTVNVGWLDEQSPFAQGVVSAEVIDKLWSFCCHPTVKTRGFHVCNLCTKAKAKPLEIKRNGHKLKLGTAEIRVFGKNGVVYAAPDLIFHYVSDHGYVPPDAFLEAVMWCPFPETKEYKELLEAAKIS